MKSLLLFILGFTYMMPSFAQSKAEGLAFASYWGAEKIPDNYQCKGTSAGMGLSEIPSDAGAQKARQTM